MLINPNNNYNVIKLPIFFSKNLLTITHTLGKLSFFVDFFWPETMNDTNDSNDICYMKITKLWPYVIIKVATKILNNVAIAIFYSTITLCTLHQVKIERFEKTKFDQFCSNVFIYVIAGSISAKITVVSLPSWCGNFVKNQFPYTLCQNCAFPQNVQTKKLGQTTIFYTVYFAAFLQKLESININRKIRTK